jgi:uncharacterized protein
MKGSFLTLLSALSLVLVIAPQFSGQTIADPALSAEIAKIKAIDNHAHPTVALEDKEADTERNQVQADLEPFPNPLPLRPENPAYIEAWRALYGYKHHDLAAEHVRELLAIKARAKHEKGNAYPAWVLDQIGIEAMLANRIKMGRGLTPPRFRWVAFVDALLFPLSNEREKKENPDYASFYPNLERLLKIRLSESNLDVLPASLDEYLAMVVTPTLEREKRDGAIAVKFQAGYFRALDFANPPQVEARHIYAEYVKGAEPPSEAYKTLQDYLFRYIAREAGRLGLAVHIHAVNGIGSYYKTSGSNPVLLDSVFNDPTLRKTNFVLVHGGFPWTRETTALFDKPNVYADCSAQTFLLYPRALSETLRQWLEYDPEKVLFGTDAEDGAVSPDIGWEELAWVTTRTARQALALALTGMMNDGEITRERALQIARMMLRDNAIKLYNLRSS